MSTVAGVDYSSHAIDIVQIDEDTGKLQWDRVPLPGPDAFDRAREVRNALLNHLGSGYWDDVMAVGIEDPRGYNSGALYRIQGAVLQAIPRSLLVQPFPPSVWRKAVGLSGAASKDAVQAFALPTLIEHVKRTVALPQDTCDAYCIALATKTLLRVTA